MSESNKPRTQNHKTNWVQQALLFVLLGVAALPAHLAGQAISSNLTGAILDASGSGIPNATVTAENASTGVKTTTVSESTGVYRFQNLPVGTYNVAATASGFASSTVKGVRLELNATLTQNFTLGVGATSTTVEVSAASVAIDTTTAQIQSTYETRQLEEVPSATFSRSAGVASNVQSSAIWNVTLLSAGVSSNGGVGQGTGPTIAGQRPENNTFYLDGVGDNNLYSTGPLAVVSNDAVAQVSLLQNQFSAEFGGASGGVFNAIVKTGTNSFHGSIYEYFQNRNLNADDAIYWTQGLTSFPRYDNNRLGATIGGPIIKNKFFFFGNFEYNPIGQASVPGSPIYAPTAAGYAALASDPNVSSTNLGVLQKYVGTAASANQTPLTVGGASIPIGSVSFAGPNYNNSYNAIVALDYNVSDSDQIRGRWIYNKIEGINSTAVLPSFWVSQPNNTYMYTLSEFHTFNPTLQNEFRTAFSRNYQLTPAAPQTFPGLSVFPDIDLDELNLSGIGGGSNEPSGSIQNVFEAADNVTKIAGRHTIKFGYNFADVILTNYFIQRVRGEYEYKTLQQYLYDLTPNVLGERSAGPTSYPTGFLQNAAFVNDDYKVSKNLTLNLGVRYEYDTVPIASRAQSFSSPASVPGGINFAEPKYSPNDWSPRIGFAYAIGETNPWVMRGGFSRAFDNTYANLTANAAPSFYQTTQDVNLQSNAPNFLANGGLAGIAPGLPTDPLGARAIVSSYIFGQKRPYALTWTYGIQHSFAKDYSFEVRYIGTRGVHLWTQSRLNIQPQVSASNFIPTFTTMPSAATLASLNKTLGDVESYIVPGGTADSPNNQLASLGFPNDIVAYAPEASSSYNGLALQLNKRYANGLSFVAAYTWSHMLDNATATNFSTYLTPRRAQDFQDLSAEWSSSALDRRHRFTFSPLYDWRPFKNGNWWMKNLVGNWTFSGTYTYQSPEYATVQSGVDSNLNGDSAGDRTIINLTGNASVGSGVTGYLASGAPATDKTQSQIVAYVANNPNARYIVAGEGALANGGRNTFPLKPTDNIDLGVEKRFSVTERVHLEIGAQFFNVLNHAQYTGGYLSDVAGSEQINSRNDLIPSNGLFGRFDQFYSSNSRFGQLSAKMTF